MLLLLSLAFRNLAYRRLSAALMMGAVALGVALVFGTQLASASLLRQVRDAPAAGLGEPADYEVQAISESGFDSTATDAVRRLGGVVAVVPRIERRVLADAGSGGRLATLWGIDVQADPAVAHLPLTAGRWLRDGDGEVAINGGWASAEHLRPGSLLQVRTLLGTQSLTVRGVLQERTGEGGRQLYVPLLEAQRLLGSGSHVTTLTLRLEAPVPPPALRDRLAQVLLEDFAVRDVRASARAIDPMVEVGPLLWFSAVVAVMVAFLLLLNAFRVGLSEQRREIGLLRLAGASGRQVRTLVLLQAWAVGALGGILGLGLAALLALWSLAGTGGLRGGRGTLPTAGAAFLLGLAVTTFAALLPARQATHRPLLMAFRAPWPARERGSRRGAVATGLGLAFASLPLAVTPPAGRAWTGVAIVAFLGSVALLLPRWLRPLSALAGIPFAFTWPVEARLARQQLLCWPRRSAATVVAVALSVATMLGLSGLALGVSATSDRWVASLFVAEDLLLSPTVQGEAVLESLRGQPGVARASPVRYLSAATAGQALTLAAVDPIAYRAAGKLDFAEGCPDKAWEQLGQGPFLLLTVRMARELGRHAGDHLEVSAQGAVADLVVAGLVRHSLPGVAGGDAALIGTGTARTLFGAEGFDLVQLTPTGAPGTNWKILLADLARQAEMEASTVDALRHQAHARLERPLRGVMALALVAVVLGLLAAVNGVLLNVEEGRREIALLQAIGMTRRQAARVIVAQAGMLTTIALTAGVSAGALLAWALVHAGASPSFRPVYVFPLSATLAALAGVLGATFATAYWPVQRARRRNLAAAIRLE